MTAGYDKRFRRSNAVTSRVITASTGALIHTSRASTREETVISYRDHVLGEPVLEKDIDPYGHFLKGVAERKRDAMVKTTSKRSSRGALNAIDNGHPFKVDTRYCRSVPAGSDHTYYTSSSVSSLRVSTGPISARAEIASADRGRALFAYLQGPTGEGNTTWYTTPYIKPPSLTAVEDYGKRALVAVQPLKPDFDLFRAVGELERLPSIPFQGLLKVFTGRKPGSSFKRELGNEWLNYQFGLKPLWSDIVDFLEALKGASERLLQIQADAGKIVRRKHEIPTSIREARFHTSGGGLANGDTRAGAFGFGLTQPTSTTAQSVDKASGDEYFLTQRISESYSFSGAFSYVIPVDPALNNKLGKWLTEMDRVIKLGPSTSALWELTPWSWLVDWFVAVGSSLDSAQLVNDDNLVINWGYAMRTTRASSYITSQLANRGSRNASFRGARTETHFTQKVRVRANPYGFITSDSVDWDAYKLSIIAALGLSRFG